MFIGPGSGNVPHDEWRCFVPNRSSPGEGNLNVLKENTVKWQHDKKKFNAGFSFFNSSPDGYSIGLFCVGMVKPFHSHAHEYLGASE